MMQNTQEGIEERKTSRSLCTTCQNRQTHSQN